MTKMMPPPETLDLARRILAHEASEGSHSEPIQAASVLIYEKLRPRLCALAGPAGYQALLSRALAMARGESPGLQSIEVMEDGRYRGLGEPQIAKDKSTEGEVILLAHLLGLFLNFIGEALTLRLIQDVAPYATVITKSDRSAPFKTILREAIQLKKASERLQSLAEEFPIVEDALLSVSGSITNTATLLEVLVHIRDESDSLKDVLSKEQTGPYVM